MYFFSAHLLRFTKTGVWDVTDLSHFWSFIPLSYIASIEAVVLRAIHILAILDNNFRLQLRLRGPSPRLLT